MGHMKAQIIKQYLNDHSEKYCFTYYQCRNVIGISNGYMCQSWLLSSIDMNKLNLFIEYFQRAVNRYDKKLDKLPDCDFIAFTEASQRSYEKNLPMQLTA